jgi:hypothetical protein
MRKLNEAVRVLKAGCKDAKLSMPVRIRCAEWVLAAYGIPSPPDAGELTKRRIKEVIRALMEARQLDAEMIQAVAPNATVLKDKKKRRLRYLKSKLKAAEQQQTPVPVQEGS